MRLCKLTYRGSQHEVTVTKISPVTVQLKMYTGSTVEHSLEDSWKLADLIFVMCNGEMPTQKDMDVLCRVESILTLLRCDT